MPLNCPLALPGLCTGCRELTPEGDKCSYYLPPIPIKDILTSDERIDQLEEIINTYESVIPSRVLRQIRKEFNQLKGELIDLRNKLNDHIDKTTRRRKRPKTKGTAEEGTVEV